MDWRLIGADSEFVVSCNSWRQAIPSRCCARTLRNSRVVLFWFSDSEGRPPFVYNNTSVSMLPHATVSTSADINVIFSLYYCLCIINNTWSVSVSHVVRLHATCYKTSFKHLKPSKHRFGNCNDMERAPTIYDDRHGLRFYRVSFKPLTSKSSSVQQERKKKKNGRPKKKVLMTIKAMCTLLRSLCAE